MCLNTAIAYIFGTFNAPRCGNGIICAATTFDCLKLKTINECTSQYSLELSKNKKIFAVLLHQLLMIEIPQYSLRIIQSRTDPEWQNLVYLVFYISEMELCKKQKLNYIEIRQMYLHLFKQSAYRTLYDSRLATVKFIEFGCYASITCDMQTFQ